MVSLYKINKKLHLDVNKLDSDYKSSLLHLARNLYEKKCTKEGYVVEVTKVIDVIDNTISATTNRVIFDTILEFKIIKPEVGKQIEGKICMLMPGGIFVDVLSIMKVFVPIENSDSLEMCYGDLYKVGTTIRVEFTQLRYADKNFSCLAKLVT